MDPLSHSLETVRRSGATLQINPCPPCRLKSISITRLAVKSSVIVFIIRCINATFDFHEFTGSGKAGGAGLQLLITCLPYVRYRAIARAPEDIRLSSSDVTVDFYFSINSEMLRLLLSIPRFPLLHGGCLYRMSHFLLPLRAVLRAVARLVVVCQGRRRSETKVDHLQV